MGVYSYSQPRSEYSNAQFQAVISAQEQQLERVRDEEIKQLKIVLGRRFTESRKPDLLLRLAELYVEKYRFSFFKENEIYQALLKQGQKPKYVNHTVSYSYLKFATDICRSIIKSKVSFSKWDQVYYFLAYNAHELGNAKEANRYYKVIADQYPQSQFSAEAFRNLAEQAFSERKYTRAIQYYEKASQYKSVQSYPRTLYKLAWAYFKIRQYSKALDLMKQVVKLSREGQEQGQFVGLRDEALNDLVAIYSEAGEYQQAQNYFSKITDGSEIYIKTLSKLSTHYSSQGKYKHALSVNRELLNQYGSEKPELVAGLLTKNIELYKKLSDSDGENKATHELVQYFIKHADDLSKEQEKIYSQTKGYLYAIATDLHQRAQRSKDKRSYSRSADYYEYYLQAFLAKPSTDKEIHERSQVRVYRSDALLASERHTEALIELERVLIDEGNLKFRKEAGTTLLNLLIKKIDQKYTLELEKKFIKISEIFEKIFPQDSLVPELRYKKARLMVLKSGPSGLSDDALGALEELVDKYPQKLESVQAAKDLVSDALKKKNNKRAAELSRKFLSSQPMNQKFFESVLNRTSFETVQEYEKEKEYEKAAQEYESLSMQSKDKEISFKAINNAAVNYEKVGNFFQAFSLYEKMLSDYPSSAQLSKENLKRIVIHLLWQSRFKDAATLYTKLGRSPKFLFKERLSFLHTAYWIYKDIDERVFSIQTAQLALKMLCHSSTAYNEEECHALTFELAQIYIKQSQYQEALTTLKEYLRVAGKGALVAQANYEMARLYSHFQEHEKARKFDESATRANIRNQKLTSVLLKERNFAAHSAFLLSEFSFIEFQKIKLELPSQTLKSRTQQKLKLLEKLVKNYQGVVSYEDGEWGLAALERLYEAFSSFSRELENAPSPPGLDPQKLVEYHKEIQKISKPIMDRSVDYLKQGYQIGTRLFVTTPTFRSLRQKISLIRAREYPPAYFSLDCVGFAECKSSGSDKFELKLLGVAQKAQPKDLRQLDHDWRKSLKERFYQDPKAIKNIVLWNEFGNLEALSGRFALARLFYSEALSLNPKDIVSLNNLASLSFLEGDPLKASQQFLKAIDLSELHKDIKFNFSKLLLHYHQFARAKEVLVKLANYLTKDFEIQSAFAVSLLGTGELLLSGAKLKEIDASSSKLFILWYNWCVWALLSGNAEQKEDAKEMLKDMRSDLVALEKNQVELVLKAMHGK